MTVIGKIAHIFVPRSSNNYRARLLHHSGLVFLIFLLISFKIFLSVLPSYGPQVLGYAADIDPDRVIELTNVVRNENDVSPLILNNSLAQAALAKGTHMLEGNYWAHVSPDGKTPWDFFREIGYSYRFAGENLARDFPTPDEVVNAWMASPSHRDNLLSARYREIGIAVIEGDLNGIDTTLVVQMFGAQLSEDPRVGIVAASESDMEAGALTFTAPLGSNVLRTINVSPLSISKIISFAIVAMILAVLSIDALVIFDKKLPRTVGRTLAHLSFLGMILVVLLIFKSGQVL